MRPSDLITPQMLPPAQAEALPALPPQAEARGSGAKAPEPTAGAWGRGRRADGQTVGTAARERRETGCGPSSAQDGPPESLLPSLPGPPRLSCGGRSGCTLEA